MHGSRLARLVFLLAAVGCLLGANRVGETTRALRAEHRLTIRDEDKAVPPEYILTSAVLGGFRGVFITSLWMRAQNMKLEGQFWEMVQIYNIITKLQPNIASAWAFAAWDLAWNVSAEVNDREERVFWVYRGIQLLRDQGIRKNPRVPELMYELAWIYYFKIGGEMDDAYPGYRRRLADRVDSVMLTSPTLHALERMTSLPEERADLLALERVRPVRDTFLEHDLSLIDDAPRVLHPGFFASGDLPEAVRALADEEETREVLYDAMAWLVARRIREEFNMDPARMRELMERYGRLDWRVPFAHSLYWASEAERIYYEDDPELNTLKFQRIMYGSLQELVRQGRLVRGPRGEVYYTPEPAFIDAVIAYMDELLEVYGERTLPSGRTFSLTGVRAGYENFLRGNILEAWIQGREEAAKRYLAKYIEVRGRDEPEYTSVAEFEAAESKAWVEGLSVPKINRMLFNYLSTAYWHFAIGDSGNYENNLSMARYLHRIGRKRWPNVEQQWADEPVTTDRIPAWGQLHRFVLQRIFLGLVPDFSRGEIELLAYRLREENPSLLEEVLAQVRAERSLLDGEPPAPAEPAE
jgi:hypothetical protein